MALTPKQKKIIIVAAAVAIVGIGVYMALPKKDNSGSGYDDTGNGGDAFSNNANFNAQAVADELYQQLKGSLAQHDAVMDILRKLNSSQFSQVYAAFGKKPYNTFFGNQYTCLWCEDLPLHPLKVWLESEMWESEYNFLKLKFKSTNLL